MSTQVKVTGFVVALVAAFAIAFGIGSAVGTSSDDQPATETGTSQPAEPSQHQPHTE